MPAHAAAGRPKVNGEQVVWETAETQSKGAPKPSVPKQYTWAPQSKWRTDGVLGSDPKATEAKATD